MKEAIAVILAIATLGLTIGGAVYVGSLLLCGS